MIVFITGASSGFGKAIAKKFASQKYDCIITGRRADLLQNLYDELTETYSVKVLPLVFDVQDKEAVFSTIEKLPDEWKNIDVLVNNAGLALGREPFDEASLDDWETMINTNIKGLLYVSKAVMPFLIKIKKVISSTWVLPQQRSVSERQYLLRYQVGRGSHQQSATH